jgi:peptidylprolyl isomerase
METTAGKITIRLYDETPIHKANFLKLVRKGFYNGLLFHRVIEDFMIQGGDPLSKNANINTSLGVGGLQYTLAPEINASQRYHKKGALAAARKGDDINPNKRSSACQFYIVEGKVFSNKELDDIEMQRKRTIESKLIEENFKRDYQRVLKLRNESQLQRSKELEDSINNKVHELMLTNNDYKFTPQQRLDYTTNGGTPYLDGMYTVFGEVIEGLDIVEKISKVKTGIADRPINDIRINKASCK